ncbi:MAG: Na(+)-translocating NADH-quinone reductase subunit C, partial [Planctomycetes bacterium]|nr:Na(+)-translocating NADH-quinone reductase subunit C [Planctomycetota bacterium]
QQANKLAFMKKNSLIAAGLFDEKEHSNQDVEELFKNVETRIVNLETGEYTDEVTVDQYDQRKASKDPQQSKKLSSEDDPAVLKRREKYSFVYLVKKESDGSLDQIVLPIRGYGLWSTLYGFLALDADTTTIRGITFYEHGETPGLGGEVDNPAWKAKWNNPDDPKLAFDENWDFKIEVIKGVVTPDDPQRKYKVDGLSGATITTRGVSHMLQFWLGKDGFGPFLKTIRAGGEL